MDTVNRGMTEADPNAHMRDEMEHLKDSFNKLRNDVADLFSHALGFGRGGAEAARGLGMDAMETVKSRFNDLKSRGTDQMHMFEDRITQNPLRSAMIAFGAGFILAKLMRHRS